MAVPDHEERSPLLSARDVAALNRARAVLKRIEDAAWRRSLNHYDPFAPVTAWDLGRLSEAASTAEGALFHLLATARANCGVKITDAQLYGTERDGAHAKEPEASEQEREGAQEAREPREPAQQPPVAAPVLPVSPPRSQDVRRPSTTAARGPIRAV